MIVVGVDGSASSRDAIRWAVDEARVRKTTVRAVYAWQLPIVTGFAYVPADVLDPVAPTVDGIIGEPVGTAAARRTARGSSTPVPSTWTPRTASTEEKNTSHTRPTTAASASSAASTTRQASQRRAHCRRAKRRRASRTVCSSGAS